MATSIISNNAADRYLISTTYGNRYVDVNGAGLVTLYWVFNNMPSGSTSIDLGTMPTAYRPIAGYALGVIFNSSGAYEPVGSIWINGDNGQMSIFKPSNLTSTYVFITYLRR